MLTVLYDISKTSRSQALVDLVCTLTSLDAIGEFAAAFSAHAHFKSLKAVHQIAIIITCISYTIGLHT